MNEEHVEVVWKGTRAIRAWHQANPDSNLDLCDADLSGAYLVDADLALADLTRANLSQANLHHADLTGASLCKAILDFADLTDVSLSGGVDLSGAHLNSADLSGAYLRATNLIDASLIRADLAEANLTNAVLFNANLSESNLLNTNLSGASLNNGDLSNATFFGTLISGIDLSEIDGLDNVNHRGPSPVSTSTLRLSKGQIPDVFLRGCGLQPWEVLHAKLYDPLLTRDQIAEIHNEVFQKMVGPPIGGIFISYSHENMEFAEQLDTKLNEKEYSVWRDEHSLVAGPMERQVFDAIRAHDVVLLVLSEASVNSDWVELELEKAVTKEKEQGRPVLCPVALDDSWKDKLKQSGSQVLWRKVKEKNVLDFSGDFDEPFRKLVAGMAKYYGSEQQGP